MPFGEREKICIFACGGHGTRMGGPTPKQFLRINGRTILQHSIERMAAAIPGVRIILVLPSEWTDFWKRECVQSGITERMTVVKGGITRFHSVKNALAKTNPDSLVAVHDAVRPFAGKQLICNLFKVAEEFPAVVPVIPVTDTLKALDSSLGEIEGIHPDRSILYGAQTPQVFWGEELIRAYSQPYDPSFTDDASVYRSNGGVVKYVPGEKYNIKITTPEDLSFASGLLL